MTVAPGDLSVVLWLSMPYALCLAPFLFLNTAKIGFAVRLRVAMESHTA